jgi:hypothetical protein
MYPVYLSLNKLPYTDRAVTLQPRILEVLGSNLSRDTGYLGVIRGCCGFDSR